VRGDAGAADVDNMDVETEMKMAEQQQEQQSARNGAQSQVQREANVFKHKHLWQEAAASGTLQRLRHRMELDSKGQMQRRMGQVRRQAELVRGELERIENAPEKDAFLLRQFIVDCFPPHLHRPVRELLLGHHRPHYVTPAQHVKYYASLLLLCFLLIMLVLGTVVLQLPLGSRAIDYWVLVFFLALLQDALILQPLSVLRSAVLMHAQLRVEVMQICHLLKTRFRFISRRKLGIMSGAHAFVQHFNPACRAARSFPHLSIARFLIALNDHDVPVFHRPPRQTHPLLLVLHVLLWPARRLDYVWVRLPYFLREMCYELLTCFSLSLLLVGFRLLGAYSPVAAGVLAGVVLASLAVADSRHMRRRVFPALLAFFLPPAPKQRSKQYSESVLLANSSLRPPSSKGGEGGGSGDFWQGDLGSPASASASITSGSALGSYARSRTEQRAQQQQQQQQDQLRDPHRPAYVMTDLVRSRYALGHSDGAHLEMQGHPDPHPRHLDTHSVMSKSTVLSAFAGRGGGGRVGASSTDEVAFDDLDYADAYPYVEQKKMELSDSTSFAPVASGAYGTTASTSSARGAGGPGQSLGQGLGLGGAVQAMGGARSAARRARAVLRSKGAAVRMQEQRIAEEGEDWGGERAELRFTAVRSQNRYASPGASVGSSGSEDKGEDAGYGASPSASASAFLFSPTPSQRSQSFRRSPGPPSTSPYTPGPPSSRFLASPVEGEEAETEAEAQGPSRPIRALYSDAGPIGDLRPVGSPGAGAGAGVRGRKKMSAAAAAIHAALVATGSEDGAIEYTGQHPFRRIVKKDMDLNYPGLYSSDLMGLSQASKDASTADQARGSVQGLGSPGSGEKSGDGGRGQDRDSSRDRARSRSRDSDRDRGRKRSKDRGSDRDRRGSDRGRYRKRNSRGRGADSGSEWSDEDVK